MWLYFLNDDLWSFENKHADLYIGRQEGVYEINVYGFFSEWIDHIPWRELHFSEIS